MSIGEPYIKHIEDDICELRPLSGRIFFAAWDRNRFLMLHQFIKKTQETPSREVGVAKRRLKKARNEVERYEDSLVAVGEAEVACLGAVYQWPGTKLPIVK
jgi:phage-related protein